MNVLLITFDPPENVGGTENRARLYYKGLSKAGHKVLFVKFSSNGSPANASIPEREVTMNPSPLHSLLCMLRLFRLIRKNAIRSIFILTGSMTFTGLWILATSRLLKLRSASFFYGKDILKARNKLSFARFAFAVALRLSQKLVVNSYYTASLIGKAYMEKISVLYPCIDHEELNSVDSQVRDSYSVLFVGRLVKRKGVDDLLSAFKEVKKQINSSTLHIVGDGPELFALKELSFKLGLQDSVKFYGALRGKDLYRMYSRSAVLVLPSKRLQDDVEGFGTVVLEAAYFSIPSVVTDSGGLREAVVDNLTGIIVPESDKDALAKAISLYLANPILAKQHGNQARNRVLNKFTLNNAISILSSILECS